MAHLVSSWADGNTLPENYVQPLGLRPGDHVARTCTIPVIDLSKTEEDNRAESVQQIVDAAQKFGSFQVINSGIKTSLMDDARSVFEEFFRLPVEEKVKFCSLDVSKKCILYSSSMNYDEEEIHSWRDTLRMSCTNLEESMELWPQQPPKFREVAREYATAVKTLGTRILELICEGLGLEPGYFSKGLSQEQILAVNHAPPCPDPSLTLAVKSHCDSNLITILSVCNVPGYQIFKDNEWIGIETVPGAIVLNMGHTLQVVSNGKLKSVEHRVVTNKHKARTSFSFFIQPAKDCLIQPSKDIVNEEKQPAS